MSEKLINRELLYALPSAKSIVSQRVDDVEEVVVPEVCL
jgi:hypothetical protein